MRFSQRYIFTSRHGPTPDLKIHAIIVHTKYEDLFAVSRIVEHKNIMFQIEGRRVCVLLFSFDFVCWGGFAASTTHFYSHRIGTTVNQHTNAKYASNIETLLSEGLKCAFKYVWLDLYSYKFWEFFKVMNTYTSF
jgi:hypothetical protein